MKKKKKKKKTDLFSFDIDLVNEASSGGMHL